MLMTLRAVERMLQTRYRYGVGDNASNLPLLRLELGAVNPAPQSAPADIWRQIMQGVVTDLDAARAIMAAGPTVAFDLSPAVVWFDVNQNGTADRGEFAFETLGPLVLGRRAFANLTLDADGMPSVRFDVADQAWQAAYTHMLSGFAHVFLAFDPTPIMTDLAAQKEVLAHAPDIADTRDLAAIEREIKRLRAEFEAAASVAA